MSSTLSQSTRVSLIKRARLSTQNGDWDELIASYTPFIDRVLVHLGFRGPDLEDLRQEVTLRLWKGLDRYRVDDPTTRFRAWLSRVIRNAVANKARSSRRRPTLTEMTETAEAKRYSSPDLDKMITEEWQARMALT